MANQTEQDLKSDQPTRSFSAKTLEWVGILVILTAHVKRLSRISFCGSFTNQILFHSGNFRPVEIE